MRRRVRRRGRRRGAGGGAQEGLRIYPGVPEFARLLSEDVVIDGFTVRRGAIVLVNVMCMHRSEAVWDSPMTFDPERWCVPDAPALPG